jgi:ATP synthase F1 delta subunit
MIPSKQAKLYAHAFLNVFYKGDATKIPYENYLLWFDYLKNSKKNLFILSMSSIAKETEEKLIDQMLIQFSLKKAEKKLLKMLIDRTDLSFLPEIILHLCSLWEKAHNQQKWIISSATELSADEQKQIITQLKNQMHAEIIPTFQINPSLFGGFTLQSKQYFLDYSLNAFLNKVTHFIKNQG